MEFDSYTPHHRAPRLAINDVGENLTVDGVTISLNGSYTYDTITLKNNATLLVDPFDGTTGGFLNFTALVIVIEAGSAIIADGAGYRGGAGGAGGYGFMSCWCHPEKRTRLSCANRGT